MLLYPEKGLVLSRTAAETVLLCTGDVSVEEMVDRLAARYGDQPRATLEGQVRRFLEALAARGLLQEGGAGATP
jgi:hypothetical protein